MKKLILAALLCLPVMTHAFEPYRLDGMYLYSHVEVGQVRDQEIVPSLNTTRFKELVADKYNCKLRGDFFDCQKVITNVSLPESIESELNHSWNQRFFVFLPSPFDPSLTNESDSLMEWDIFDNVRSENAFQASEYHYYLIKSENEIHKISINFASGQRWFNVANETKISTPIQKIQRIAQFKSRIFELNLVFNQKLD